MKTLPGLRIPFGSKTRLIARISGSEVAVLELERPELAQADAVLARARAAARERVDDEALDELVGARELGRVVGVELEADVDVAVAGVAEDGGVEAETLHLRARERDRAGQLGDGDARVGRALVAAGRDGGRCVGRGVPRGPEPRAPSGSGSSTISVAPSGSASSRTSARSASTVAAVPAAFMIRQGPAG